MHARRIGRRAAPLSCFSGLCAAALVTIASGCAHRFPTPYPAMQLARDSEKYPGQALVHYLSQPSADPSACDLSGAAAHVARVDDDLLERLADALFEGRVAPAIWTPCARALFPHLGPAQTQLFVPRLATRFVKTVERADADPGLAAQLSAVAGVLAERPVEIAPATMKGALEPVACRLRSKLQASPHPGPLAAQLGRDLLATLELEMGELDGQPVTAHGIEAMEDQTGLRRLMVRLPDPGLRAKARERLIRVRIAASTRPEVRARAAEVEAAVSRAGRWAPEPAASPVGRAWFRSSALGGRTVLVRQDVLAGRAALLASSGTEILAAVPLEGELLFELTGFEQPVTLCASAEALSVEPCVDASRVGLATPMARLDADGVMRFAESVALSDVLGLLAANGGAGLLVRPTLDGRELTRLEIPLWFERPPNLRLISESGMRGPDLFVRVTPVAERFVFSVTGASGPAPAPAPIAFALEQRDAANFALQSAGAPGRAGMPGMRGMDGTPGFMGSMASCPGRSGGRGGDGGPGGRGGDGGPGGRGGDGGNVRVELACGGAPFCPEMVELVKRVVQSVGGSGGPGGAGGSGGSGGMGGNGGSGMSCFTNGQTTYVSGGKSGNRGPDGMRGLDGPPGSPGNPGAVTVTVK